MSRTAFGFLSALCLGLLASSGLHAGIVVDGNWNDWGINPTSGDWTSSHGTRVFFEDYTGTDGTAYLGPGWGGQFFDVEAVYLKWCGNEVCYGIVTGFDPDGVRYNRQLYTPGDIFVNVGGTRVGVDIQTGHLFKDPTFTQPGFTSSGPFTITGGTDLGATELSVPFDGVKKNYDLHRTSSTHYFFEGCLDLAQVGGLGASYFGIHWTMSCGNDVGDGRIDRPTCPEPATLSLFGLGGLAAVVSRRRKAARSSAGA